jgi:hypothetical protein
VGLAAPIATGYAFSSSEAKLTDAAGKSYQFYSDADLAHIVPFVLGVLASGGKLTIETEPTGTYITGLSAKK